MSRFKEAMKRAEKSFLGTFGEPILYNGNEITGIDELGSTWQKGGAVVSEGSTGSAFFSFSAEEVPNPKAGDVIVFNQKKYHFLRIIETDGVIHKAEFTCNESGFFGNRR